MNQASLKEEEMVELQDNACYATIQKPTIVKNKQSQSAMWSVKFKMLLWVLTIIATLLLLLSVCSVALLLRMSTPVAICQVDNANTSSSLDESKLLLELFNESYTLLNLNLESGFKSLNETIIQQRTAVPTPGIRPEFPAPFCATILHFNSYLPSGYYWLQSSNGSAVRVYCDMTTLCGGTRGWRRIAHVDMTQHNEECPSGLELYTTNITRTCRISNSSGPICSSTLFSPAGLPYSSVCGKIQGFQFNTTDAFDRSSSTIEEAYLDGVSITYCHFRRHIWSFGSGADQGSQQYSRQSCPCSRNGRQTLPSFVGSDYFCESGTHTYSLPGAVYLSDPLWDGKGCGHGDSCCSFNNPPWFMKRLSNSTSEDLEMRVCRDQDRIDEDILIEQVDLLVW